MIEIEIKGRKQFLFQVEEEISTEIDDGDVKWTFPTIPDVMKKHVAETQNIRIIAARGVPDWGRGYIFYVYWYDEKSIATHEDQITETTFQDTVVLEYATSKCSNCQKWWHTLMLPRATPFAADPIELNWKQLEQGKVNIQTCPNCGFDFRQPVIMVIASVENS